MHTNSADSSEHRLTLEATVDLVNHLDDPDLDLRDRLEVSGFSGTDSASAAAIGRLERRMRDLRPFLISLPDLTAAEASAVVNTHLRRLTLEPSITTHDGSHRHVHWTPASAPFDDKVLADVMMSLAQEICDNGTERFGHCGAIDCDDLYYDATRNHRRRFCANPRCASRTHTADHRRRRASR